MSPSGLDQFGVGGQRWERPAVEPGEHGVGDVAHAGLKRRQDDSSRGRPPEQDGPGREASVFLAPGHPSLSGIQCEISVHQKTNRSTTNERLVQEVKHGAGFLHGIDATVVPRAVGSRVAGKDRRDRRQPPPTHPSSRRRRNGLPVRCEPAASNPVTGLPT